MFDSDGHSDYGSSDETDDEAPVIRDYRDVSPPDAADGSDSDDDDFEELDEEMLVERLRELKLKGKTQEKRADLLLGQLYEWKAYVKVAKKKAVQQAARAMKVSAAKDVIRRQTARLVDLLPIFFYVICVSGNMYKAFTSIVAKAGDSVSGIQYWKLELQAPKPEGDCHEGPACGAAAYMG